MDELVIEFHERRHTPEITSFVADRYYKASHFNFPSIEGLYAEIDDEDRALAPACVTVVARGPAGEILSTARLIERTDDCVVLPVEKVFGVSVCAADPKFGRVMEFARLASEVTAERGIAWRLAGALYEYCKLDPARDTVVAGIDANLFGILRLRGWPLEAIGESLFYLGSRTVPIRVDLEAAGEYMTVRGLMGTTNQKVIVSSAR